jgi:CxxC motif-containing protein
MNDHPVWPKKTLTCIVCPIGCTINVVYDDHDVIEIEGNNCARGREYARHEAIAPRRTVTTSVLVVGGERPLASVRTVGSVPKGKVRAVVDEVRKVSVKAPVKVGDVILENVAGTGEKVIATRNVPKKGSKGKGRAK